ncbi:DUF3488 and transglutaminase-like domain-containing protein [Agromyces seonyuensis]|uniref:Transglutaminase-like domain-containing protein n=1 Tax=Agromyces seonyuensis TaxID=2662446 RepID=A0A6I4NUC4_9MICO|nr:transglutaminase domain-containing protein [Agromyces seonyuensis]MWB97691.1 hypothetical protein [Agromyces seonyuensis]
MRTELRRTAAQDAALAGAGLALVLASMAALVPLVQGSGWWWTGALVALAIFAGGFGMRAARVPAALVPPAELLLALGILTLLFGEGAVLGVVPTAATFESFGDLGAAAAATIREQTAPVSADEGLRFLLAAGAAVVAVVVDVLAMSLRAPAFAAFAVALPLAVPIIILGELELGLVVLVAALYLLLLWVDVRVRRNDAEPPAPGLPRAHADRRGRTSPAIGSAVALAGAGLLLASIVASSLPMTGGGIGSGSISGGTRVTPFVDLAADLRRPAARQVLHYTTSDDERVYFGLMTLDEIDGAVWRPSESALDRSRDVARFDRPAGLAEDVAVDEQDVRVWVDRLDSSWLPVPAPVASVEGLEGDWYWDASTRAVRSAAASSDAQEYTVSRLVVEPTAEQLRAASLAEVPADFERFTELPEELPASVADALAEVTADAATPYDAATALQAWLRGPTFDYSLDTPVEAGYDGGSLEVVEEFLDVRSGFCVHFASTMAIMARAEGIPARIVLGYMPGDSSGTVIDGRSRRNIDSHDLHTWPELYFEGVGWVPFEPTPGRGVVPDYSRVTSPEAGDPETPATSAPGQPGATTTPTASAPVRPAETIDPEQQAEAQAEAVNLQTGVGVLACLILLLLPALLRALRTALRRGRILDGGADGARAAWSEVRDTAVDLGEVPDHAATVRGFAARIRADSPGFRARDAEPAVLALERITVAVERAEYARPGDVDAPTPADVDLAVAALRAERPWWRALLSIAAPRSFAIYVVDRAGALLQRRA